MFINIDDLLEYGPLMLNYVLLLASIVIIVT